MRIISLGLLIVFFVSCETSSRYPGPLSPEESLKTFSFAEDFKAEIFVAEPYVVDPVCMQFDEQGNVYVVDMPDAYKPDSVKGRGRIIMLKDINHDGRVDSSIVFADSLREASSILPWQGGLLIAAAPNIMYYKDLNGDGRADQKEIVFSGFFTGNEEAQITNLRFGIDNWIYANNSGQAGEVTFTRKPGAPKLQMQGSDLRFRLDRNQAELTTGPGQFGLAMDDWGHRFFTNNSFHIRQVVVPRRYLDRNPYLPADLKSAIVNISDHDPLMFQQTEAPYWRQERTNRRNKDFQENHLDRIEYARDHFTAASGGTFYGGDAFPAEYYGNIFTGDVSGNLVHRDMLVPSDTTPFLVARRPNTEKDKEFLSSTDTWFRPSNFSVGPDGNLYMLDMYRQHIETPISIPDDLETDMDFNAGHDMGRIYRIVPKNAASSKATNWSLKDAKSSELVTMLSNKNQWWRLQAQRLLLERQDRSTIPQVKELLAHSDDARTRLHALYVLEGMDALDATVVRAAMKDPEPGVRENAAILAERFLSCLPQLGELVKDSSIRIAFQATLSIGDFKDKSVVPSLAKALALHGGSKWFRAAVLSSPMGSSMELLDALSSNPEFTQKAEWVTNFTEALAETIGARNDTAQVIDLLRRASGETFVKTAGMTGAIAKGLSAGLQNADGVSAEVKEKLKAIEKKATASSQDAIEDLKNLYPVSVKTRL